ncbi:hypothetical protein ONE63_006150 [Megalurothrips usitatus]|uniref:Alpha-carbonic anhydrase domain-containing protein n=1 Tax=Megalurothrips usitatus TaxID=439358 RepID=A0AAV7XV29_9NEOP|nr:hypothetical protein ONE63_006150 [Megalurothrips usitatus]
MNLVRIDVLLVLVLVQESIGSWEEWWTYDGISGPGFWGLINPQWGLCSKGRRQSPVNIEPDKLLFDPRLRPLHVDKHKINGFLQNTGQSLVLRVDQDSKHHVNISGGPAGVPLPAAGGLHPLRHARRPGLRAPRPRPGLPRRDPAVRLQRGALPQHVGGAAQVAGHRGHLPHAADRGDAEPGAQASHVGVQQGAPPRSDHADPSPVGARAAARHGPLHDVRGQHHPPRLLGDHGVDHHQQAHLHHAAGAVLAAQADAGLPRDPQGPAGQQRPAAAAATPPHREDQHRLLQGAGEKLPDDVQGHALQSEHLERQRNSVAVT